MARLPEGWQAHRSWGRDGWDLGSWPYVVVVAYDHPEMGSFAYGIYTDGDITTMQCGSQAELYEAIDELAEDTWRYDPRRAPDDLPGDEGLLPHHRGPFSWERLERETKNPPDP